VARLTAVSFRQQTPPLAIFLSASKIHQIKLCEDTQRRVYPLRIINLLHIDVIDTLRYITNPKINLVAIDGNRLIRTEGWETLLENILIAIPLIVMDLRTLAPALQVECEIVKRLSLHWKLIVIYDDETNIDTVMTMIAEGANSNREEICWLLPDELPKTMVYSVVLQKGIPSKARPSGHILVPPTHDYKEWNYLWPERSA